MRTVHKGGTIESDAGETPRQAGRRETPEEIGLDVAPGRFLPFDWVHGTPARPPIVAYVYDGGALDRAALAAVRLQEQELLPCAWSPATSSPPTSPAHSATGCSRHSTS